MTMRIKLIRVALMTLGVAGIGGVVWGFWDFLTTPLPELETWERMIFWGAWGSMLAVAVYIFWAGASRILEDDEE
jgi:hypothetical protein